MPSTASLPGDYQKVSFLPPLPPFSQDGAENACYIETRWAMGPAALHCFLLAGSCFLHIFHPHAAQRKYVETP